MLSLCRFILLLFCFATFLDLSFTYYVLFLCRSKLQLYMPRSKKYHSRFEIVASYSDGDYLLAFRSSFDEACSVFEDIVSFRVRGYMTFRSVRLCVPSTRRVLFEYRDFRYLEQSKPFEKLYPYGKEN